VNGQIDLPKSNFPQGPKPSLKHHPIRLMNKITKQVKRPYRPNDGGTRLYRAIR
jgi:hypothetical protein